MEGGRAGGVLADLSWRLPRTFYQGESVDILSKRFVYTTSTTYYLPFATTLCNVSMFYVQWLHSYIMLGVNSSSEDFTKLCEDELYLLEMCLRVNPKSYGIWLHREWVMTTTPSPNWKDEKRLCDLFLKYDERNCEWNFSCPFCDWYLGIIELCPCHVLVIRFEKRSNFVHNILWFSQYSVINSNIHCLASGCPFSQFLFGAFIALNLVL